MMKKYAVKTRFIFEGHFIVKASSMLEAKEYVSLHCGCVIGNIHSTLSEEDVDWDFNVHSTKVIGKITKY